MDETAFKLFLQALKPINTLVYGVQDLRHVGGQAGGRGQLEGGPGPGLGGRPLGVRFTDLRAVHAADTGGVLQLEDLQGGVVTLPLFATSLGEAAREALVEGLRAALADEGRRASWEELRKALEAERRSRWHQPSHRSPDPCSGGGGSGERTLEVLEVERRNPATAEWLTPFLPTDGELSWRWVDATGCKHPHLIQSVSRREASSLRSPPCRLDSLFRSSSDWVLEVNADTDAAGWRYGLAWNASTWDSRPGLLDGLRRRRWTRTYT
uniref:Peroxin/Ferlin domain-containing protein n=1 Tax=Alexandrium catenella TaxID=2925 RepID=A0A7S1RT27_ALECA